MELLISRLTKTSPTAIPRLDVCSSLSQRVALIAGQTKKRRSEISGCALSICCRWLRQATFEILAPVLPLRTGNFPVREVRACLNERLGKRRLLRILGFALQRNNSSDNHTSFREHSPQRKFYE